MASAAVNLAWWVISATGASQVSTPSLKPGAGKGDCCSLKEKLGSLWKFFCVGSWWVILSPDSFRPCSCNLAGSTGECNVETGRCACKDNVEGFHCERWVSLPLALFQEWETFQWWPGVSIREMNFLSFTSSDANLDFSIWIPPIQGAVPPASVLDTLQFAPTPSATVSIVSPPASSLVKLNLPLYLGLRCRLKSEAIKKPAPSSLCKTANLGQAGLGSLFWKCWVISEVTGNFHVCSSFVQLGRNEFTAGTSGTQC